MFLRHGAIKMLFETFNGVEKNIFLFKCERKLCEFVKHTLEERFHSVVSHLITSRYLECHDILQSF